MIIHRSRRGLDLPLSGAPIQTVGRTPSVSRVAFLADALRDLLRAEPLASAAVLTPSPESSTLYHEGLARCELPGLHRVRDGDFTFAPGVEVTEVDQAKGLEFDYVVLLDVSADKWPATPAARRQMHVGATRAAHQLWVTSVGEPSPIVAEAMLAE